MYAMVRNVAVAPASSVEKDDPRSLIWKNFPMNELSTLSFIASMNFMLVGAERMGMAFVLEVVLARR